VKIGGDEDLMRKWEEFFEVLKIYKLDQVRIEIKFQIQLKIDS